MADKNPTEPRDLQLLLSCEHGGNRVPAAYAPLFAGAEAQALLASHRGWDPGALDLARYLAAQTGAPLIAAEITRLLVDPNRSIGHPQIYSRFSKVLPKADRAALLAAHYHPYRQQVAAEIERRLPEGPVLHLAVHTFTRTCDGQQRPMDLALLYAPQRPHERAFCHDWHQRLQQALPQRSIRRNAPYRGTADALVTALRRRYPADRYLGIELELCQDLATAADTVRRPLWEAIRATLQHPPEP